jgi:co-chaperonin GroES (HSP10)
MKGKPGNGIPLRPVPQPALPTADAVPVQGPATRVTSLDLLDGARAVGLWLLLERVMDAEKSKGGIILPDAVREKPAWVVRSVGDKVTIPVKVGDHVAFDGTRILQGTDQKGNPRAVCFAMEGQIMGVLNPEALRNVILTTRAAP